MATCLLGTTDPSGLDTAALSPGQEERALTGEDEAEPRARIPFTVEQDRTVLAVRVGGSRPLSMILDTGHGAAAINLLSPELGEELKLTFEDEGTSGGAGGGPGSPVRIARGEAVEIGGLELATDRIVVMRERRAGFPEQDGVLGAHVILRSFVAEIDFDRKELILHEPKGFEARKGWSRLPLDLSTDLPVIEAKLDLGGKKGIPVELMVDLGGRASLVLTPNARKAILPPEDAETETFGGAQGKVTARKGRVERLVLGDLSIPDVPATFTDQMHIEDLGIDGILGIHVIRELDLILDYHHERILIRRNETSGREQKRTKTAGGG